MHATASNHRDTVKSKGLLYRYNRIIYEANECEYNAPLSARGSNRLSMNPPAASDEASSSAAELTRDEERAVLLAAIRTLAVRYAVLMPKFKAVAFLQPEDHVSKGAHCT